MHDVPQPSHQRAEQGPPELQQAPAAPPLPETKRAPGNSSSVLRDAKTCMSKSLSVILLLGGGIASFVQWLYDYVVLFALHLFYLNFMVHTPSPATSRNPSPHPRNRSTEGPTSPPVWIPIMNDLPKRCYSTLFLAVIGLYVGTYVIQYSRQAIPRMLGFISLVVVLDSVLTSILLSSIAQLAVLVQGTAHVFPGRLDNSASLRAARLFAVPLSSSIWCLLAMMAAGVAYCSQTGAAAMELPVYQKGHVVPGPSQAQPPPTPTIQQPLPKWAVNIILHIMVIVILRFIYVLYSVIRLRQHINQVHTARHDPESMYTMTTIPMADGTSPVGARAIHTLTRTAYAPGQTDAPTTVLFWTGLVQEPEAIPVGAGTANENHADGGGQARLNRRPKQRSKKQSAGWVRPTRARTSTADSKGNIDQAAGAFASGEPSSSSPRITESSSGDVMPSGSAHSVGR